MNVCVLVAEMVGLALNVGLIVNVLLLVKVWLIVNVWVMLGLGVNVLVFVLVLVTLGLGLFVFVLVKVLVPVNVAVGSIVNVGVIVGLFEKVGLAVNVAVAAPKGATSHASSTNAQSLISAFAHLVAAWVPDESSPQDEQHDCRQYRRLKVRLGYPQEHQPHGKAHDPLAVDPGEQVHDLEKYVFVPVHVLPH